MLTKQAANLAKRDTKTLFALFKTPMLLSQKRSFHMQNMNRQLFKNRGILQQTIRAFA